MISYCVYSGICQLCAALIIKQCSDKIVTAEAPCCFRRVGLEDWQMGESRLHRLLMSFIYNVEINMVTDKSKMKNHI